MPRDLKKLIGAIPWVGPKLRNCYQEWRRRAELRRLGPAYAKWIAARLAARAGDYPAPRENAPQFDLLTLTYETDPAVLRKTAESVFAQDYPHWRWVIWDNASTRAETHAVLDELARHPQVVLHRSSKNLGITTGHRYALELCQREYVALLDHDDLLYADSLRIVAWHIDQCGRPGFLYSDEDKCDMQERRQYPFFKPDISPAYLLDTGYTCHFAVINREQLLASGAFSDPGVEGTQDWDMALRLLERGCRTVHVPEVLYTWRAVPQSTAIAGVSAKPYVLQGQRNCLERMLDRRGLADRFAIRPNPLFPTPDGHWQIVRKSRSHGPLVDLAVIADDPHRDWTAYFKSLMEATHYTHYRLRVIDVMRDKRVEKACAKLGRNGRAVVREVPESAGPLNRAEIMNSLLCRSGAKDAAPYLAFVPPGARITTPDWLWEALTCLEVHTDAAVVGGRLFGEKFEIRGGAALFGGDGVVEVPYAGRSYTEPGCMCLNWCHRNVCAIAHAPWVLRQAAALDVGGFDARFPAVYFDVDLVARCHRAGWQVIYSPFIQAQGRREEHSPDAIEAEATRLLESHLALVRDDPFYSPYFSLDAARAFEVVPAAERAACLDRGRQRLRIDSPQGNETPAPPSGVYEFYRHRTRINGP